jgi:scyllo-inositol 2-dehydrogenase (NADP+)
VWFYLRGEEYSAQIDYFMQSIKLGRTDGENSFKSALQADRVVDMVLQSARGPGFAPAANPAAAGHRPVPVPMMRKGLLARLFG